jgi:septal ring factor EnvC (AmiA/AmiB activator)
VRTLTLQNEGEIMEKKQNEGEVEELERKIKEIEGERNYLEGKRNYLEGKIKETERETEESRKKNKRLRNYFLKMGYTEDEVNLVASDRFVVNVVTGKPEALDSIDLS